MGGVVGDVELAVVENQAGIAGVAGGGEGEALNELAGDGIEPAEAGAVLGVVETHGGDDSAIG